MPDCSSELIRLLAKAPSVDSAGLYMPLLIITSPLEMAKESMGAPIEAMFMLSSCAEDAFGLNSF